MTFLSQCNPRFQEGGRDTGQSACLFCVLSLHSIVMHEQNGGLPTRTQANACVAAGVRFYKKYIENGNRQPGTLPDLQDGIEMVGTCLRLQEDFDPLPYGWYTEQSEDPFNNSDWNVLHSYLTNHSGTNFVITLNGYCYGLCRFRGDKFVFFDTHSRTSDGRLEPCFSRGKGFLTVAPLADLKRILENACGRSLSKFRQIQVQALKKTVQNANDDDDNDPGGDIEGVVEVDNMDDEDEKKVSELEIAEKQLDGNPLLHPPPPLPP